MDDHNIPLIYLLNTDVDSDKALQASGFNAHRYKLNGYVVQEQSYRSKSISYQHKIPDNIHEAEIIVIDTTLRNFSHGEGRTSSIRVYFEHTPSYVDLLPLDISVISNRIFSTKKNKQLLFFAVVILTCVMQLKMVLSETLKKLDIVPTILMIVILVLLIEQVIVLRNQIM
ncbi:hypothetical protein CHQ91_01825 (plasmid) [Klebsiella michiganensis]|uniref:hypothetical protein n=1 Tax=Klebsiella michiganensis TaxID=1134687 RepID=UPI001373C387|nr:hypothetical protein [Klebsiella michiganensis]QHO84719.1 hypothetical protein CHQ91_01825 [Klebsiella michiganensis]